MFMREAAILRQEERSDVKLVRSGAKEKAFGRLTQGVLPVNKEPS